MHKGFGFYSPHETTTLFLKASLVSIWIGLDLLVALIVGGLPRSVLERHALALTVVAAVLTAGTVFSMLLAWATGTLFGRGDEGTRHGPVGTAFRALKRKPYHLIVAGAVSAMITILVAGELLSAPPGLVDDTGRPVARINLEIARKCAEIASMEYALFRSDERVVLTQCMIQYDPSYASLRGS